MVAVKQQKTSCPSKAHQGNKPTDSNLVWRRETLRHDLNAPARHTTRKQYPNGSKAYLAPGSLEMTHLPETQIGLERSAGVPTLLRLGLKGLCSSWRGCPCCATYRGKDVPDRDRISQQLSCCRRERFLRLPACNSLAAGCCSQFAGSKQLQPAGSTQSKGSRSVALHALVSARFEGER